jgi:hypothetical protein
MPGETLAPAAVRRDVSAKLVARASQAKPDCKRVRVSNTEVLEVHPDGKAAAERWSVERCDDLVHFVVTFPQGGKPGGVLIRPE